MAAITIMEIIALSTAIAKLVKLSWGIWIATRRDYNPEKAILLLRDAAADPAIRSLIWRHPAGKRAMVLIERHGDDAATLASEATVLGKSLARVLYAVRMVLVEKAEHESREAFFELHSHYPGEAHCEVT